MKNSTILIVDDNVRNRNICHEILHTEDKSIISAENGEEGLRIAAEQKPDVILLDIMMPVMDGYEMLRQLKEDMELQNIPVLMLTAKTDTKDVVKALEMGANDYLIKPFIHQELIARVGTLCRLKHAEDRMRHIIARLEHETEKLAHKAELGSQAGELAHDLSNVMAITQLISFIPDMLDNPDEHDQIRSYVETTLEAINLGSEISHGYTSYLKDIGQEAKIQPLKPLFQPLSMYAKQFKGELIQDIPDDLPQVLCKADQIKRIVINLFVNASQAIGERDDALIQCKAWVEKDMVCFSIADNGCGIDEGTLPNIFEECFTTKKNGTGLGLFMVKQVIESQGGTIKVDSKPGEGTVFTLSLPVAHEA